MNTSELLELASLDALGLLDEEERRAFEQAFRHAPASIREQIRREQARLACDDSLLPPVQPPAGLKAKVLRRVREAIEAVRPSPASTGVLATLSSRSAPRWGGRVSPLWRAACIGFATATVVLLTAGFYLQREWNGALAATTDAAFADLIREQMGSQFADVLLAPSARQVAMKPVSDDAQGQATVLVDPESGTGFLVARDLPAIEGRYRLVVADEQGNPLQTLADFASSGGLIGRPVRLQRDQIAKPFAIVRTSLRGEVEKPVLRGG
ncbi:MAG: hypothetical protein D6824_03890 [Planctomycetota bacterium]|nr:MAG: hypothetical protein D6824_03890 [Planctomycetota bacterium]